MQNNFILLTLILIGISISSCSNTNSQKAQTVMTPENVTEQATTKDTSQHKLVVSFKELEARFDEQDDSLYIFNFWATWCKPCVEELPYFERVAAEYADQKVKMVLVSLDFVEAVEQKVLPFIKKNNIQSEVLVLDGGNPNVWIDKVSPDWSGSIPGTLFLYPSNDFRRFFERSFTYEELKALTDNILKI